MTVGRPAKYGVRLLGTAKSYAILESTPEYKEKISLNLFAKRGGFDLQTLNDLISFEQDESIKKGFLHHKELESVLFKVIDFRNKILKIGAYCKEIENFLYPQKTQDKESEE